MIEELLKRNADPKTCIRSTGDDAGAFTDFFFLSFLYFSFKYISPGKFKTNI